MVKISSLLGRASVPPENAQQQQIFLCNQQLMVENLHRSFLAETTVASSMALPMRMTAEPSACLASLPVYGNCTAIS